MVWNWTFMILHNVYFWNEEFTLIYFVTKFMIMFTAISLFLSKLIILGAGLSAINLIPIFFLMNEVCKSHSDPTMGLLIFFPPLLQLSLPFGSLSLYLSTLLLCSSTCLLLLPSSVRAVNPCGGKNMNEQSTEVQLPPGSDTSSLSTSSACTGRASFCKFLVKVFPISHPPSRWQAWTKPAPEKRGLTNA